jgi:hypothetical protein
VEQTTETEGPEPDGAGFFASPQATLQAPPAFRYCRCQIVPARALVSKVLPPPATRLAPIFGKNWVYWREASELPLETKNGKHRRRGKRELSGDGLAGSLAAEFLKKIILLHGGCLAQQFKQGILQVFVLREFPGTWSGFELAQVCG